LASRQPSGGMQRCRQGRFRPSPEDGKTMTTVAAESNTKPAPRRSRAGCRPACRGPDARAARDAGAHPAADGRAYQQAHKYEKGINRVAAGRLYNIAQALGVDVSYFFEGLGSDKAFSATPQQRMLLELARNFISIPERKHRDAVCSLARALSEAHGPGGDPEE
jgi:transcriptional regulator with XRE-family HTH domain